MSCGPGQRPGTAPQLISPEIGALVEDIIGTVATYTTSSSSSSCVPRRPHTACAGARVAAVLEHKSCSDSDDESDGGSIDVDHDSLLPTTIARVKSLMVRPTTSVQTSTTTATTTNTSFRGTTFNLTARPYTAPCEWTMQSCEESSSSTAVPRPTAYGEAEVFSLEHPVPEGDLLLTGGFWGRAAASYNTVTAKHEPALKVPTQLIPEAFLPIKGPLATLPQATAEKLPRRCLILSNGPNLGISLFGDKRTTKGSGRGLMPQAARYRSHNSWANFMPKRPSTGSLSASVTLPSPCDSTCITQDTRLSVVDSRAAHEAASLTVQTQDTARMLKLEPRKPTGPKYRVVPGGSRPAITAASLLADKARQREFLVLEFRTEPRVVPAMRRYIGQEEAGATDTNAAVQKGAAAKVLVRSTSGKKSRFTPPARFRKDSSQWALEREALAGRAGL